MRDKLYEGYVNLAKMPFIQKHKIISIIISYFIIGLVYHLSFELYFYILGKETFPLIGMLVSLLFWPVFLFADFWNIGILGVRLPDILTLILTVTFIIIFIKKWAHK